MGEMEENLDLEITTHPLLIIHAHSCDAVQYVVYTLSNDMIRIPPLYVTC